MIAKGAARNNPRQLAVYLMRVERYSTGEPVELLELQSGWASTLQPGSTSSRIASRLIEAFRDWQVLTEGTQQGRDGLYHAEISPAPQYAATMTPEQWKRAADILGEELGFKDQPRAIVLHGGTDGRKHMHIVWARTDVEAMKIISDGYNFAAHEKASYRMELEFGHDFVPGKHHKRDRSLQDEFPRQEYDFAEAQMAEREGKTVAERKAEIRALQAAASNGQELKRALEDAGYILAQGNRGYIVVDEAGTFSALSKNLQGVMKKAEVEAFMADVPLAQLPTVSDAKAQQKSKLLVAPQASPHEASKTESNTLSLDERSAQIVGIRKSCDNALAFKNALEAGRYILAKGDQRGFVLVDGDGQVFSLSKLLLDDIKGKQYKAFMASIDRATLPTVDEAKALQKEEAEKRIREAQERAKSKPPEAPHKAPEAPPEPPPSKFIGQEPEIPKPGPTPSKFLPRPETYVPNPDEGWTDRQLTEEFKGLQPPEAAPAKPERLPPELYQLRRDIWQSQVFDMAQHAEANKKAYAEEEQAIKNRQTARLEDFDIRQQDKMRRIEQRLVPAPRTGWRGVWDRVMQDTDAEEKKRARQQEEIELARARQEQERQAYIKKLEQDKARELEAYRAQQLREQAAREKAHDAELDRRLREAKRAMDIKAELEANDRAREESGWAEDFKKEQPGGAPTLAEEFKKTDDAGADRRAREAERAAKLRAEIEADDRAREESGWAEDFKKEQEYPFDDGPEKGKG